LHLPSFDDDTSVGLLLTGQPPSHVRYSRGSMGISTPRSRATSTAISYPASA
jgi:hypothetical protein